MKNFTPFQKAVGYTIVAVIVLALDILLSIILVAPFHFIFGVDFTLVPVVLVGILVLTLTIWVCEFIKKKRGK